MKQELPKCPIAAAITLVGSKWKIQIIRELLLCEAGARRFGELKAGIEGVSDKMLSQSLKELEEDHLISRHVLDTAPPHAEYALTGMGRGLACALRALYEWGLRYKNAYEKLPDEKESNKT